MKMQIFVVFVTKFEDKRIKNKKCRKVRDHCYYTGEYRSATHSLCNLKYGVPKEIPIVFHNRSNYLLCYNNRTNRKVWRKVQLFRTKNWKINNIFIFNTKKVTKIDKNGEQITETIS